MSNTPAFPLNTPKWHESVSDTGFQDIDFTMGMTLRDYFAAKGLEALMVAVTSELQSKHHSNEKAHEIKMLYAKMCYAMADAMLKAREA